VSQITRRIDIPLSVDFERGYADEPKAVKENAAKLLACGVVGFNIEDGLEDGSLQSVEIQCA
jgi:2-methylisocitrate lyase-like PEP mutase family enzyme